VLQDADVAVGVADDAMGAVLALRVAEHLGLTTAPEIVPFAEREILKGLSLAGS
jgi:hypothetical protein